MPVWNVRLWFGRSSSTSRRVKLHLRIGQRGPLCQLHTHDPLVFILVDDANDVTCQNCDRALAYIGAYMKTVETQEVVSKEG